MEDKDLIPLEAAARELGSTPVRLLVDIKRRLLVGREEDGEWFVTRSSVEEYRQKKGLGAPACASGCSGKTGGCGC